jgi:hypothetical protein
MPPPKLRRLRVTLSEVVESVEPTHGTAPLFFEEAPEKSARSRRERH